MCTKSFKLTTSLSTKQYLVFNNMVKKRKADKKKEDGDSVSPADSEQAKQNIAAWEQYYKDYAIWQQQTAQTELEELELDAGPMQLVNKIIENAKKQKEYQEQQNAVRYEKDSVNLKRTNGESKPQKVKRKADTRDTDE